MSEHDYESLGLVAGLEIHQQLDTPTKLFCNCPTDLREPEEAVHTVTRRLHPTRSELGELDDAALEESAVERTFEYLAYDSNCLVELDEEPPHRLDETALETTLEIAQLLGATPVDQVHVMRKLVIDGSNTSGFQRTALVATDGQIETSEGPVGIEDLMLEEESAKRLDEGDGWVQFGLDRLGIPLVEIGTEPDIHSPEQAHEAAEFIGMALRSTGRVKRGLGTIRQDVNVSIADGARVEIKGVQRLDDIDDIVRTEVDRQVALVDIAGTLAARDAAVGDPITVSEVFADTDSSVIGDVLADGGVVHGVRLAGFDGVVGTEIAPDRRLGTEFSDHAKRHGAGGIFHTDELPAYGVTDTEVADLRDVVGASADDAVAIVAADESTASAAIEAVAERARAAIDGVPEETRGANEDGTTRYLRPLPGAARMYPETDVPPVQPTLEAVPTPELLTQKVDRYATEYEIDPGLAEQVAYGRHMPLFESLVDDGIDPTIAATTLESTLTELSRDDVPVDRLTDDQIREVLHRVDAGSITSESLDELLTMLAADPSLSVDVAIESGDLGATDEAEIREVVTTVVERNADQIAEEGMGAFSGLMGECMGALEGKAEGDVVSDLLREAIQERS